MITDNELREFAELLVAWCTRDIEAQRVKTVDTRCTTPITSTSARDPATAIAAAGCIEANTASMTKLTTSA